MAEVSRATLLGTIATNLPDNTSALISPGDVRGEMVNQADSTIFKTTSKTAPPTANDDEAGTAGNGIFGVGDVWIDETNDIAYMALDITSTAAIWTSFGGGSTVAKVGTAANNQLAVWVTDGEIEGTSELTYTGGKLVVQDAAPIIELDDNDAAADEQRWYTLSDAGTFKIQAINDAGTAGDQFLQLSRTGNQVDGLELTAAGTSRTTISPNDISFGTANSTIGTVGAYDLTFNVNSTPLLKLVNGTKGITMIGQGAAATVMNIGDPAMTSGVAALQVGNGRTGDGNSYMDLVADGATYTDFGLRMIRNAGANGTGQIIHRGTGTLSVITDEAATIDFQTNSISRLTVGPTGTVTMTGDGPTPLLLNIGSSTLTTGAAGVQIGTGRFADGDAYIDLVSDTASYGDYAMRLIRSGGTNATGQLIHRGTGTLSIITDEAASIEFQTNSVTAMTIDASQDIIATGNVVIHTTLIAVAASRALVLTDRSCILEVNTSGGAVDITIPLNATIAFPVGTVINVSLIDITAAATITGVGGVTLNGVVAGSGTMTPAAYAGCTLYKRATDEWVVQGQIGIVA